MFIKLFINTCCSLLWANRGDFSFPGFSKISLPDINSFIVKVFGQDFAIDIFKGINPAVFFEESVKYYFPKY